MSTSRNIRHAKLIDKVFWDPSTKADEITAHGADWRLKHDCGVLDQIHGDLDMMLHRAKELAREQAGSTE